MGNSKSSMRKVKSKSKKRLSSTGRIIKLSDNERIISHISKCKFYKPSIR